MATTLTKVIKFERGFLYNGHRFAFKDKKLFRLPYKSKAGTIFPMKEIPLVDHENSSYYRLGKDWKSKNNTISMCKVIKWTAEILNKHKDLPD